MKKKLTFTNILFVLAVVVYILNVFVISPDDGSTSKQLLDYFTNNDMEFTPQIKIIAQLYGFWGGHLNDLLGFSMDKVLKGEIWRIYTVVITHIHLPHIVMNMAALLIAGNHLEKKYGWKKVFILFLILLAVNDFVTEFIYVNLLGNSQTLSCGASGWVTTLMGMILARCLYDKKYWKKEFSKGQRIYLIVYFLSTTFVLSVNAFTITAHMAGLIVGFLVEFVLLVTSKKKIIA